MSRRSPKGAVSNPLKKGGRLFINNVEAVPKGSRL
jgi:hypothetical protein